MWWCPSGTDSKPVSIRDGSHLTGFAILASSGFTTCKISSEFMQSIAPVARLIPSVTSYLAHLKGGFSRRHPLNAVDAAATVNRSVHLGLFLHGGPSAESRHRATVRSRTAEGLAEATKHRHAAYS